MISTAKFKLTVKPMFKNNVKRAEPIPCLSVGTLLMTALRFGATNSPVPKLK